MTFPAVTATGSGDAVSCDTTDVQGDPLVGARVLVHYDPSDPETCAVGDAGRSYVPGAAFLAVGLALSVILVVLIRRRRRGVRARQDAPSNDDWTEGW